MGEMVGKGADGQPSPAPGLWQIETSARFTLDDLLQACRELQRERSAEPEALNLVYRAVRDRLRLRAAARRLEAPGADDAPTGAAVVGSLDAPAAPVARALAQGALFAERADGTGGAIAAAGPALAPLAALDAPGSAADGDAGLSPYQRAILEHLAATTSGDVLVDAVAGSGKTSVLVSIARQLRRGDEALVLAFNRHIAAELRARLGVRAKVRVRTAHAVGHGYLQRALRGTVAVRERKYADLCRELLDDRLAGVDWRERERVGDLLCEWARFARLALVDATDPASVLELVKHHGLHAGPDLTPDLLALLPEVLEAGERIARRMHEIDYTDMLYLPLRWELRPPRLPWELADECQDLSAAALRLALSCRAEGGRMIFVGDEQQAINGFAGAEADSVRRILETTGAARFPLPICYRCPTAHVQLARQYVPQMQPREGAPAGIVETIPEARLSALVRPGDLVLCRLTAPLLHWCFRLLGEGHAVSVRGREIGEDLCALVRAVERMEGFTFARFGEFLLAHERARGAKLAQAEGNEAHIERLRDRCAAVRVCFETFDARDAAGLCRRVEALFDAPGGERVVLSTVHRTKGSQAARVFLLEPDKMPLEWARQQDWEREQEDHVRYVALTRATDALNFVESGPGRQR